jgi:four helix bundle protein
VAAFAFASISFTCTCTSTFTAWLIARTPTASAAPAAHGQPGSRPRRLQRHVTPHPFGAVPPGHRQLRDQLTRASLSIPLNVAESCGRRSPADKAHFFAIARGSAMECAAVVDCARSLGLVSVGQAKEASWLLVRIVQMLTKLIAAMERQTAI